MPNEIANQSGSQPQKLPFSAMISSAGYQKLINNTLKDPAKAQRFVAAITSAVAINPALQACDPATVLSGGLLGESLNLSPSPQLGQYYLVPYWNSKKSMSDAQFQMGYKGYVQLALRSGYYRKMNVIAVKEGELKRFNPITEEYEFSLIEDDEEREKRPTAGYFAFFEYLNGFTKSLYWSKTKMLAHADRYSPAFSINATTVTRGRNRYNKVSFSDYEAGNYPTSDAWLYSSFWYKDFDAMAYKTMLRQLISKWGIMSTELQTAFEHDAVSEPSPDYTTVPDVALPSAIPEALPEQVDKEAAASSENPKEISLDNI